MPTFPVPLIIFDHDGTLVNSLAVVVQASNQLLAEFGHGEKPGREIVAGMVHPTAQRLGLLAGVADPRTQQDMARRYDELAVAGSGVAVLYPGIAEMLASIAELGMAQAVLSNSAGAFIRGVLERLGVAARFMALIGEKDMPAPKPDPRGLLALVGHAGGVPGRAAYVGDSRTDLLTARAAGVRALGVTWGAHPRRELEPLGFDVLVDSPSELVAHLEVWS
jgi:phosphoglycolate phosphatase-like HAD superfamily hydrolase